MAVDPLNPPSQSGTSLTVRPLGANLPTPATAEGLCFVWVEGQTSGAFLPGLYLSLPTTPQGTIQWTYLGGIGFRLSSNNEWVYGSTNATSDSETVVEGPAVVGGGSRQGVSVRVGGVDRQLWAKADGTLISGDATKLNTIAGGQISSYVVVNNANHVVVDGNTIIDYIAVGVGTTKTVTLPVPSAAQAGRVIIVKDASGICTATEIISISVSGGTTIEGAAAVTITNAYGMRAFACMQNASAFVWVRLGST